MKANEVPERIYVCDNVFQNHVDWEGSPINTKRIDDHDIEYTRTDAFMKKAENFLEMLGYWFIITDDITHANYDKEQLIEDFRKYMEGE